MRIYSHSPRLKPSPGWAPLIFVGSTVAQDGMLEKLRSAEPLLLRVAADCSCANARTELGRRHMLVGCVTIAK